MNADTIKKAVMAGVAGTVIMTVFAAFSHYVSLPKMDFPGMIASQTHMGMPMAWMVYFGFGIVLAYFYGSFFMKRLPMHSTMRGMIYALMLWGVAEAILMPALGMGFFPSFTGAFAGLVGMGLYGATVGFLYEGK